VPSCAATVAFIIASAEVLQIAAAESSSSPKHARMQAAKGRQVPAVLHAKNRSMVSTNSTICSLVLSSAIGGLRGSSNCRSSLTYPWYFAAQPSTLDFIVPSLTAKSMAFSRFRGLTTHGGSAITPPLPPPPPPMQPLAAIA